MHRWPQVRSRCLVRTRDNPGNTRIQGVTCSALSYTVLFSNQQAKSKSVALLASVAETFVSIAVIVPESRGMRSDLVLL